MTFPFASLVAEHREIGLVVAVILGFGFGFVLERAGFGRAPKLAAQFYLRDMRVFKVMFSAILTAMVGMMVLSGFGLADLEAIATSAVSWTYIWPMLVGGLILGAGFITAGYCPGTSLVSAASGNMDGLVTFAGVIVGSLAFGEIYPMVADFHVSGNQEHMFLYDVLGIPAPVLAVLIVLMAIGLFMGAEKVEKHFGGKAENHVLEPSPRQPRRLAFATFGGLGVLGLVALALPTASSASATPGGEVETMTAKEVAQRVLDEPWTVRVVDLRAREACSEQRIPGAECVPEADLGNLGLPYAPPARDLVLVADGDMAHVPEDAVAYEGRVFKLEGGFPAWKAYALTAPEPPKADATKAEREEYVFRSGLHAAMTGTKQAAPSPAPTVKFKPKKKKGGGCN
ncbi:MAG: YeeE/YedE thiosulfate transporter family protein [Myxococcota bacterium]